MNKKFYIAGGIILVLILGIVLWFFNYDWPSDDALKFKSDYEAYNNKTDEDGSKFQTVTINKKNKIKYIDFDEMRDNIENATDIIYIGSTTSKRSRSIAESLIDILDCSCLEELHYLELNELKDKSNLYTLLCDLLKDYTEITISKNIEPIIIGLRDGKVVGYVYNLGDKNALKAGINNLINETTKEDEPLVCDETC